MKKSLFVFCLCVVFFLGCGHQKSGQEDLTTSIELIDSVWSFGHIKSSSKTLFYKFRVKNVGQSPLVLRNLSTTCGCVELRSYSQSPIQPNGFGYISVAFDPKKSAKGFIDKKVEIHSNAINFVEATVTGFVE